MTTTRTTDQHGGRTIVVERELQALSAGQRALATWGVLGVVALIVKALVTLTPMAVEAIDAGLSVFEWVILVSWCAVNAYAEGYVGFHRKFSPRASRRAAHVGIHPTVVRVVLAWPYVLGLFDGSRRTVITGWSLLVGITLLVVLVRQIAQPWRGIIDAGVVVGLSIGLVSLLLHFVRTLGTGVPRDGGQRTPS